MEHGRVGQVAELDVLEADLAADLRAFHRERAGVGLGRHVEHGEDALGAGDGRLDHVELGGEFVDGAPELPRVHHEGDDDAHRDAASQRQPAAGGHDEQERQVVDEVHRGAHQAAERLRPDADAAKATGDRVERRLGLRFAAEGLHGALAGDHLLGQAVELADGLLAFAEELARHAHDEAADDERERQRDAGHDGHPPADPDHEGEGPDQRDDRADELQHAGAEGVGHHVDVVREPAHELAVRH